MDQVPAAPHWHRYAVPLLLLAHGLACWLARPVGYLTGQDDVEYMALGQSIREGSYSFLFRVDAPLHSQYPPGYPAMLAVWGVFTGDGFGGLALLSVLVSVAALGITYAAFRRVADARVAIATLAVLALNPSLVIAGGSVASEAPFMLMTMLALALVVVDEGNPRTAAMAGGAAILAALTRSIGIVLVAAIGLHWLMARRWKRLAVFAVAGTVFVGGWLLWTVAAQEHYVGSSYVADLQATVQQKVLSPTIATRVMDRARYYLTSGLPFTLGAPTIPDTPLDNIVSVAIVTTSLLSGWWLLLRRWRPAGLYLALYGALLLFWMWGPARFLVPLVPILVGGLLAGLTLPLQGRRPRLASAMLFAVAGLLMVGGAVRTSAELVERSACRDWEGVPPRECVSRAQGGYFAAVSWIAENVPDEDIFLVAKPGALWYYAGNRTVSYPQALASPPDGWAAYLRGQGVDWILLSEIEQGDFRYMVRLEHNCEMLEVERRFENRTFLFRLMDESERPNAGREETGQACEVVRQFRSEIPRTPGRR